MIPPNPRVAASLPLHPRRIKLAIRSRGELRRFYQRRRKRGLRHLSAVTATALKFTRTAGRICSGQRDYLPAGRPTNPAARS